MRKDRKAVRRFQHSQKTNVSLKFYAKGPKNTHLSLSFLNVLDERKRKRSCIRTTDKTELPAKFWHQFEHQDTNTQVSRFLASRLEEINANQLNLNFQTFSPQQNSHADKSSVPSLTFFVQLTSVLMWISQTFPWLCRFILPPVHNLKMSILPALSHESRWEIF